MELNEKLTSGFIEAYIPSKDTASYLRSLDHQFSEAEKRQSLGITSVFQRKKNWKLYRE